MQLVLEQLLIKQRDKAASHVQQATAHGRHNRDL